MQKIRETEKVLKALANKRRLAILNLLQKRGRIVPGSIADEIKLSFKATSKHLGVLFAADLVDREQVGPRVDYFLKQPAHKIVQTSLQSL